jgi:hypothetical protein
VAARERYPVKCICDKVITITYPFGDKQVHPGTHRQSGASLALCVFFSLENNPRAVTPDAAAASRTVDHAAGR